MLVLPQLVDLTFQDINLTLESCCVCHLATLIAHKTVYARQEIIYSFIKMQLTTIFSIKLIRRLDFKKDLADVVATI